MYKHSWEHLEKIYKDLIRMEIAVGSTYSVEGIIVFTPTLWIDFLNADPQRSHSMWLIYREFSGRMEELRDWLTREGHSPGRGLEYMELISREDFLTEQYAKMRTDTQTLHTGMTEVIDGKKLHIIKETLMATGRWSAPSSGKETLTKGADVPDLRSTITVESVELDESQTLRLDIPAAGHPGFWLSAILGVMLLSCKDGDIPVQRCLDPDCQKFFIPSSQGHEQKFHSQTCRSRFNSRKWRKSLINT